jgi:hypothetical protein
MPSPVVSIRSQGAVTVTDVGSVGGGAGRPWQISAPVAQLEKLPLVLPFAGSMGVEALCKALRSAGSSGLKELDLSHTAADDKAAAALAGLLGASRVLERLALTHTNMTDAGAQLLCNALQVRRAPCMAAMTLQSR